MFDEKMQCSNQISSITKKVNFKLGKIKAVASSLISHTKTLLMLMNALVINLIWLDSVILITLEEQQNKSPAIFSQQSFG